jgi:hypothetical protein
MPRKVITENEAINLEAYMEVDEIRRRFKIVPMNVLDDVIRKGLKSQTPISVIADSVGLAYISVYKQVEKIRKAKKIQTYDPKHKISKADLLNAIKDNPDISKLELSIWLSNRLGEAISVTVVNRVLREYNITLQRKEG